MSTKDNWDDSSDDEEVYVPPDNPKGDAPPDPLYEANEGDAPPDPLFDEEEPEEEEEEFVDAKASEEGYPTEEYTPEDEWGGEGGDPPYDDDYEDELDDYDKKLGRYVSCR